MAYEFQAIDAVCNYEFDDSDTERPDWSKTFITKKIGADPSVIGGFSAESFVEKMDRAGIDHAFLIAVKAGSSQQKIHRHISYETVAAMVKRYPKRFSGLAGVDPTEGMKGIARLEYAIKDLGFVGAHLYPHWFEMAPDANRYYPIYAKCAELDVPILKLVGIHIGWPWVEEMISDAYKHPNDYNGSDAYAPAYWDQKFIHFIDSWGSKKVIFGTDFPVIDPERARADIEKLDIRPEAKRRFLRDNVIDLYKLDLPKAGSAA